MIGFEDLMHVYAVQLLDHLLTGELGQLKAPSISVDSTILFMHGPLEATYRKNLQKPLSGAAGHDAHGGQLRDGQCDRPEAGGASAGPLGAGRRGHVRSGHPVTTSRVLHLCLKSRSAPWRACRRARVKCSCARIQLRKDGTCTESLLYLHGIAAKLRPHAPDIEDQQSCRWPSDVYICFQCRNSGMPSTHICGCMCPDVRPCIRRQPHTQLPHHHEWYRRATAMRARSARSLDVLALAAALCAYASWMCASRACVACSALST